MLKTTDGKWIVFDAKTGKQLERWPVDAKLLLANGECTAEPPEGVDPVVPVAPPRHVGVPRAPVARVFEAPPEGEEPAAKPPKAPKPPKAE